MTLKKLNAIEIEGVEPSLLVQAMTCKPFFLETGNRSVNSLTDDFLLMFGYFWLFFSFFFRCTAILSLSLSCDNAFISPHPPQKKSPPFPFPIPAHKRKAEILKNPDTLQY